MRLETIRGADVRDVTRQAEQLLGPDAMIVRTRVLRVGGGTVVEAVVAAAHDIERFRRQIQAGPFPPRRLGADRKGRPLVLALVGPTGAGKTTTAAKLAVNPIGFGGQKVGFLSLDTFRVAALEQLEQYADIASLPMEVVYEAREVEGALKRLARCDVVLVDTPGRSPKSADLNSHWRGILDAIEPDETHLVLPATMRLDLAVAVREQFDATHALITKLDEVPNDSGLAELAARLDLPARWLTDGQDVPGDISAAPSRVMSALGGWSAAGREAVA